MKSKNNIIFTQNKRILRPLIATLGILLIPFFGNILVDGWNWSPLDFITMGVLIFVAGLLIELVNKKLKNKNYKILTILGILFILLVIWAELAVGALSQILELVFG